MNGKFILDSDGNPQPCDDLLQWARWFENTGNRIVKQEYVGQQFVSTVFLGIDHSFGEGPPLLYETMILHGTHDGYQTRCGTREESLRMHAKALSVAREEIKLVGEW